MRAISATCAATRDSRVLLSSASSVACCCAQHRTHARHQRRMVDRLRQVVVPASLESVDDILAIRLGGDEDDRDEGQRGVGLEAPRHLDPVEPRHHDVEQDEVGEVHRRRDQRGLAIARRHHLVSLALQPHGQDLDVLGGIVDDEDAGRLSHSITSLARRKIRFTR